MCINVVDSAVFCNQFSCTDFANSLHTRYIVRCVTADGKYFYDLFRSLYSIFLTDLLFVDKFILAAGFAGLELYDVL